MTLRDEQKQVTRDRILDAAVRLLVEEGLRALSTVSVQRAAGVSRGAILHHFPTMKQLSEALVEHLIAGNEESVRAWMERLPPDLDPVQRAVASLYEVFSSPAFHAELELWTAARTNHQLRAALVNAERAAGRDLRRVLAELFGPRLVRHPAYPLVGELTMTIIRGLGVSHALRSSDASARQLIDGWAAVATQLLADTAPGAMSVRCPAPSEIQTPNH